MYKGGGINGPDEVASSRIISALASLIFPIPMHLKTQNDDRPPVTEINDFMCEWVNVSSGTGLPE